MNEREKSVLRYISALDNADFQTVSDIWREAENDSELMQALLEIHQEMKGHTTMIPFPISRQMNTRPVRWLRVAVALLIAAGVILLALTLSSADSPVRSTPLQQGDTVITADNAAHLEIVQTLGKGQISGAIWSPDGQTLAFYGSTGFWFLDNDNLDAEPVYHDVGQDVFAAEFTEDSSQIIYDTRAGISALTVATGESELLIPDDVQSIGGFDYYDGLIAFTESRDIAGIWDIERGRPLHYFQTYSLWNSDVVFSADGSYMAYAALMQNFDQPGLFTQQITVIDVDSGKTIQTLKGIKGYLGDLQFFGDQVVATGSGTIFTWEISATDDNPVTLDVEHPYFSDSGLYLNQLIPHLSPVTGGFVGLYPTVSKSIFRYTPADDNPIAFVDYEPEIGLVQDMALHPSGQIAVTITHTGNVDIVDLASETVITTRTDDWNTFYTAYNDVAVKNNLLAVSGREEVEIYDLTDGSLYHTLSDFGDARAIRFAEDEPLLVIAGSKLDFQDLTNVVLWNYETDTTTDITEAEVVFDVAFGPGNNTVYYVDRNAKLKSYERSTEDYARLWEVPESQQQRLNSMAMNPDRTQIALASWGTVNIYDIERAEISNSLPGHPYQITKLDYSPDGAWLVSLDSLGTLIFRDTQTWNEIAYLSNLPGEALAVSPDGSLVATGRDSISIVDTTTHEVIAELEAPSRLLSLIFSDDGTRLIGASANGKIYIWGVPSGQ